ncbi:MAG: hypothetical protein E7328_03050 [Clostridiales bacterium]|nr:hypothetical protein [Clostridiales bacterium]
MIGFVCGIAGSGKTRRMVDMANAILNDSLGKIVFIDDNSDRMFDLKHAIRLVNAGEYGVNKKDEFYGFVAGIIAGDFDIHTIFVDSFLKFMGESLEDLMPLLERLDALSDTHKVKLIFSISADADAVPDFIKDRTVQ